MQKDYSLQMPADLYNSLSEVARERDISVAELMRRGIKWELMSYVLQQSGGRMLVERPGKRLREIVSF